MKKLIVLSLLAAFCAAPLAARAQSRGDYVERVTTCEAILQGFMADPATAIPADVLKRARGIIIINQFRAGFVIGVKDGYGVVMVRRPDNTWSMPALLAAGGGSIGFQIGANSVETIYLLMNDATPRLLFNQNFHVGVDTKAVAGPHVAQNEHTNEKILQTPVLVYSKDEGLYAGASVTAGYLTRNDPANRTLYNTNYTLPEILYSNWVTPPSEVQPLMAYVSQLTN
ncbi:MAG: lipid-binding SYLF domain-containing protein [Opitutales bacterium]